MALVQLVRLENVVLAALLAWIGLGAVAEPATAVAVLVTVAAILAAGNVVNDLVDADLDEVGKPWRPLPSGRITRSTARVALATSTFLAVVGIVLLPSPALRGFAALMLAVAILYSIALKGVPLVGNVIVAFQVAAIIPFAAAAGSGVAGRVVALAGVIFLSALAYEVAKTGRDRWYDRLGIRTAATAWPAEMVWWLLVGLVAADAAALVGAALLIGLDWWVTATMAVPMAPLAWFALRRPGQSLDAIGPATRTAKWLFVPAILVAFAVIGPG